MVKDQNFNSPLSPKGLWLDKLEENLIAIFLGLMTLITFANVIARYVFNDNLLWALQTTVFLFAWMVLLGAAYCVKKSLHLGVDILVERLPKAAQKPLTLISVLACLAFSICCLKGVGTTGTPSPPLGPSLRSMIYQCRIYFSFSPF